MQADTHADRLARQTTAAAENAALHAEIADVLGVGFEAGMVDCWNWPGIDSLRVSVNLGYSTQNPELGHSATSSTTTGGLVKS